MKVATAVLALALCALSAVTADQSVGNGVEAGQALTNSNVQRIALTKDVNLNDCVGYINKITSYGANPYTLTRSVEFYSSGNARFTLDFGYLAGVITLAPGITVTFTNLRLLRGEAGIPVGVFKSSPGAFVILRGCEDHREVCPASSFNQAFFLSVPRAGSGSQSGYAQSDGSFFATDITFTLPTTPAGLGGYTISFQSSAMTCDTTLPLPAGYCSELPAAPGNDCTVAVRTSVKQALCSMPGCINYCAMACSK